jgi:hypothetical protein
MASGWANDDAVQEQIDSTINDAIARARNALSSGESNKFCEECGEPIPERADGHGGVRYCVNASRRKIYITIHFQDIIAEAPRIASFADNIYRSLPHIALSFRARFLANDVAKCALKIP